jgi:F-type H+-transporting ATPase subunit a
MEHHVTWFTALLNKILGPAVLSLLEAMHIHVHDPQQPIPEFVAMGVLVVLLMMVFVLWLKPRLSVDNPGATQQVIEVLITNPTGFGIRDLLDSNVGHHGRKFLAAVGSVTIFVLVSNLISVLPIFTSPTAHPSVPLACALVTFIYFNWQGIRANGVIGYLKHFMGPSPFLAPLLFPVEIISTSARILSLTVRLWANMFSSELVYFTILGLFVGPVNSFWHKLPAASVGLGIFAATLPVAFVALHVFVAVVQALVFTILPAVYLGQATAHEH